MYCFYHHEKLYSEWHSFLECPLLHAPRREFMLSREELTFPSLVTVSLACWLRHLYFSFSLLGTYRGLHFWSVAHSDQAFPVAAANQFFFSRLDSFHIDSIPIQTVLRISCCTDTLCLQPRYQSCCEARRLYSKIHLKKVKPRVFDEQSTAC